MHLAAAVLVAVVAVPCLHAQGKGSTLPSTPPTALPASNALPAPIADTPTTGEQPANKPHHAAVTFIDGQLDVRADNSSLNQILRSISRQTGLKITGGVEDQRVFGNYGPASVSSVLATLLDGTGTNILLLEGDATNPPKLVLTPRGSGPTPPSPDSLVYAAYDDSTDENTPEAQPVQGNAIQSARPQTPATSGPVSIPQPLNNVNGSPSNTSPTASTFPTTHSVPIDTIPTPSTTPATSGIVDAPNPPPPGSTTGTAPNGTLTPEQVAQELLRMQQQKQQQPQP
jgi:hypothetical protein